MPETTYTPFTYLIGWSWLDIWYYGGRWKPGCHPDDLWTSYFTSSVYVAIQRWLYGEPDVIEIRKTFKTKDETQDWEIKVLKRMRVRKSERWLNKTDRQGPSNFGIPHSDKSKRKIRESNLGKRRSEEVKLNMSNAKNGKPKSEKWKQSMSKTHLGVPLSEKQKQAMRKPKSEEGRLNMKAAQIKRRQREKIQ